MSFVEFFNDLMQGKLIGLKCRDCGSYTCPPKSTCDNCGSRNLEKVEMSGKGKITSFTTIHVAPMGYDKEAPYVVSLVELDEGPWIIGRIEIDAKAADELGQNLIGKRVSVFAKEMPSELFYVDKKRRVVPYFKLEG